VAEVQETQQPGKEEVAPRTGRRRIALIIKLGGGGALLIFAGILWLGQPEPVQATPGFPLIQFFAPAGQVSVASAGVTSILYSFDGSAWKQAGDLHVAVTDFERIPYATARLEPDEKAQHARVFFKYVKEDVGESPAAEFSYDPAGSIAGDPAGSKPAAGHTIVYANDFEGPPGSSFPEWSSSPITFSNRFGLPVSGKKEPEAVTNVASPKGNRRFLGEFGGPRLDPTARTRVQQTARLALRGLAPHTRVTVRFDLLVLKSWDGSSPRYGPDRFCLQIKDGPILFDTTFSNNPKLKEDQSFQDYPRMHGKPQAGAAAVQTLGYTFFGDSIYHLSFTFPHNADTLVLDFAGDLFEGKGTRDESWGLDDVSVSTDRMPPS
jgi:hypothetical protein